MESKGEGLGAEGEEQGVNPRRHFIAHSGALAVSALMGMVAAPVREGAWAAGTDAPEKRD